MVQSRWTTAFSTLEHGEGGGGVLRGSAGGESGAQGGVVGFGAASNSWKKGSGFQQPKVKTSGGRREAESELASRET